jgi:hypothetical protein
MKRATLVRGVSDTEGEPEADPNTRPVGRTTREVVQALIRDPKTSARDVASLTNALTRMNRDGEPDAPDLPVFPFVAAPSLSSLAQARDPSLASASCSVRPKDSLILEATTTSQPRKRRTCFYPHSDHSSDSHRRTSA